MSAIISLERRLGLTDAGLAAVLLLAGSWGAARLLGARTLYLLVYTAAAGLVAAVVLARRRRPLTAQRSELPARAREGQSLRVELTVRARRRLTSFVLVERLHPHLGGDVRVPVGAVGRGREVTHSYEVRPRLRGVYEVGPLVAEWADPLGLSQSEQVLAAPFRLIVHPAVELAHDRPLARKWEDPPIRPPQTRPWPAGLEFYGMRDYVPGDDLRRVVWRAVARTGRLLVREYEQGITDRVSVLLDTDAAWHRPGDPSDTFEAAVRVAASLGVRHLREGFTVSLEGGGGPRRQGLRGPGARIPYLDELAAIRRERAPLARAVERLLRSGGAGVHHVVITPRLDAAAAAGLRVLVERGASVLVVAISWEESDPLTLQRASEIGAQVVEMRPGAALAAVTARALGAGTR